MITIYHGEDIGESRKSLNQTLDKLKGDGTEVVYLEGARMSLPDLEQALESSNLFFTEALVIEGLLTRLRSKLKDTLIAKVASYSGEKTIFLWEGKEATKPNLKAFDKSVKVNAFKAPAVIFQLTDSLKPKNFEIAHSLLISCAKTLEPGFIFVMVARHLSNLLIAKSGDASKLIPFTRGRLIAQAASWEESQLLLFHSELLRIDRAVKTGTTKLDYISQLDLLLASLLN